MNILNKMNLKLNSLVIFRNLLKDNVIFKLAEMLSCYEKTTVEQVKLYASFVAQLFEEDENLTGYLLNRMLEDENIYMLKCAQKLPVDYRIEECLVSELKALEEVAGLTSAEVKACINYEGYLPEWKTYKVDFNSIYMNRVKYIASFGYGIFAKYHTFIIREGNITPVRFPDSIRLSNLEGYEREKKSVIQNTIALLKGKPAANILLSGDAGTGKSSTVKAVANEFKDQGIRLIEVTKEQLRDIPVLMDSLSKNPLKFILFIDDLSFTEDDDSFGALKGILEGSVSVKSSNIVIYATSNRRHIVRESFSDREGDDIHRNDTIQGLTSLSDRFGLCITFTKPDKKQFLEIVHGLAEQYQVNLTGEQLELEAERFALRHSGRSPRVARQFVEYLKTIEE
jgi:predicted AAA+ superfamily ATPase